MYWFATQDGIHHTRKPKDISLFFLFLFGRNFVFLMTANKRTMNPEIIEDGFNVSTTDEDVRGPLLITPTGAKISEEVC